MADRWLELDEVGDGSEEVAKDRWVLCRVDDSASWVRMRLAREERGTRGSRVL